MSLGRALNRNNNGGLNDTPAPLFSTPGQLAPNEWALHLRCEALRY